MKQPMIICALVVSLALTTWTTGHGDEGHGKREHPSAGGHATAVGRPGNPDEATRSIEVEMDDTMRYRPDRIRVKAGETIRFLVKNVGKIRHEMVLGTMEELKEHAALMRKSPGMEHAEPNEVSVQPGKTGELIWRFTKAGTVHFGCLEPGHFEAGMIGEIVVGREAE